MRKLLLFSLALLFLSACTNYGGIRFKPSQRNNIRVYTSTDTSSKFVKNNIWSISGFLRDKLPRQKSRYEVYILDRELRELLADEDFQKHILERIDQNVTYRDDQKKLAANLALADMFSFIEDEPEDGQRSLFFIPLANIVLIRNDRNYDKDFFLYASIFLALIENNPEYYLNRAESRDEKADLLLFRYLLTGFNSIYSRYFSKYHISRESKKLYLKILEIDRAYLEDIYRIDLGEFKNKSLSALVNDGTAIQYYPYFFQFLFNQMDDHEIEELIDSFFVPDTDPRELLRGYFYQWMNEA